MEKGVVSEAEAEAMSDEEALNLIFRPGFSTAQKVSEVSGRGVGMDVVRSVVARHHGQVHVESQPGRGTTIRLEIPIRQATLVIDGLMVAEGDESFVIPFENVREIARIEPSQLATMHGRPVVTIRDRTYDAVRLAGILGLPGRNGTAPGAEIVVVVQSKQGCLCLRMDRVIGHRQVVVTGLQDVLQVTPKVMGIAQLGAGKLAPVLNIPEIVRSLQEHS